jgi:hypothetical protein
MAVLSSASRLTRGAIVSIDPLNPLATTTIFQYNPSELTRSLEPQTTTESDNRSEPMRLKGPPIETITLKAEIDAADQLSNANPLAVNYGIYPQLSALEMLIYPKSAQVIENTLLLAAGTLEILPSVAPLTVFVWGTSRILPVRITSFSITEQAHDVNLNPIRADVSLSLRVLSYEDLSVTSPGYQIFLTHQIMKETLATLNMVNNVANLSN